MTNQNEIDQKKAIRKNDLRFAGVVLTLYSICCVLFGVGAFFSIKEDRENQRANATATEAAFATQQANVTATIVAHITEQAQYDFIDRYDRNKYRWRTGKEDNDYWIGWTRVTAGEYSWEIVEVKKTFISWADLPVSNYMRDFDVYVDTKLLDTTPGDVCSGLQFRVSPASWDNGGYYFALCSDASVNISYHTAEGWERIATRTYKNYSSHDWNRIEISARGAHFKFFINGEMIYEMDDDRQESGGLALVIELNEKVPATILFDNFGLQRR